MVEYPAVTISVTKKPGQNAVAVADAVIKQIDSLKNVLIPTGVEVKITRNYGETANDKAQKLIPVSYTHLDVYKRQIYSCISALIQCMAKETKRTPRSGSKRFTAFIKPMLPS